MKKHTAVYMLLFTILLCFFTGAVQANDDQCLKCHEKLKKAKFIHPVLDMGCSSCHAEPHKNKKAELSLISEQPDLCYGCHDKGMFTKKNVHAAVASGCTSCHNPHSSDNGSILTSPVSELCAMCHDKQASGRHVMVKFGTGDDHPVKGKTDPSRTGKELSCTSCHNPHSSEMKTLFTNEKQPDNLCEMCHVKVTARP